MRRGMIMATYDNTYSRFIAWAKIILPLLALGLLSTLFMFSRSYDPDHTIPYSDVDIDELAREPRLSAPNYAGVTAAGAALSVFADVARPDPDAPDVVNAEMLRAAIDAPDGLHVDINALRGNLDSRASRATLLGDVVAETSTGFVIRSQELTAALDDKLLSSDVPVQVTAPFGELDAGRMELGLAKPDGDTYLLVFNGGVKLVYTPQN